MPDEDDPADRPRDGHRRLKKPHWRAKFFSKDDKRDEDHEQSLNVDEDVLEFLGSSPQKQPSHSQAPSKPGVSVPRIDVSVSQRWPDSNDISSLAPQIENDQIGQSGSMGQQRRKRPRREGLKVSFSSDQPAVIGEGGDEATLPTIELPRPQTRQQKAVSTIQEQSQLDTQPRGGGAAGSSAPIYQNEEDYEPRIIVRAPTGVSDPSVRDNGPGNTKAPSQAILPYRPPPAEPTSQSPVSGSFAARMRAKMRAEEGLVFHSGVREPSPANEDGRLRNIQSAMPQRPIPSPLPTKEESEESMAYPLRPTPVPAVQNPPRYPFPEQESTDMAMPPQPPPYQQSLSHEPELPGDGAQESPENVSPEYTQSVRRGSDAQYGTKSPMRSIRSAAMTVSEDALGEFAARVSHYNSLFSLAAESVKPLVETSLIEWVRCGTWWFLKGRSELETYIRSRSRETSDQRSFPTAASEPMQAFLDLAKALWINQHIIPLHPELTRYESTGTATLITVIKSVGDQDLAAHLELHHNIIANLRALTMSMKRNSILPPAPEEANLLQGLDNSIWIKYPFFLPEISALLSGNISKSMVVNGPRESIGTAAIMPLGDTEQLFCYSRMFVDVWLTEGDDKAQPLDLPCVLSVLRNKNRWTVMANIASQNGLVNLGLNAGQDHGPTWDDVHWSTKSHAIRIRMPRGFELNIQFKDHDFKSLWNIVDDARRAEISRQAEVGESLIFDSVTSAFQYVGGGAASSFPSDPSKRCRIRVFERTVTRNEGFGQRMLHRGFRLTAVTSPNVKTLSSVSQILGSEAPILFSYLRGDDGAPAFMIKIREGASKASMILTFHEPSERADLHAMLIGSALEDVETETREIPLFSFAIEHQSSREPAVPSTIGPLKQLNWRSVRVVSRKLQISIRDQAQRTNSGSLRICLDGPSGTITDRINNGPGELQLSLNVFDRNTLQVLRTAQEDLTICVVENTVSKDIPDALADLLKMIASSSTIRTYKFTTLQDLHIFQQALTGFVVSFDGVATSFAISRRRMVVPIYKRWEANLTRLQILKQDKVVELIAFFSDFAHGECMNFNIKSTDVFESFNRSGKYYIRLVDAKFALPKGEEDETKSFVCLDLPEYPGEHDDITIAFETESDRESFQAVLPASLKEASRISALRK